LLDVLVRRWRASFPSAQIVNFYGPTETTMIKFFYQVPAEPDPGVQPAGWPLPQTQALLFSIESESLCDAGEVGEIVIRTPFRTLGYLNAPEEQQRRFIRNPFRDDRNDLLYRTGDRGRYRADGALEILGRLDQQVKIQGVRIEPDEVSATIAGHPAVNAGVVVARQEPGRDPVLVAYVVAAGLAAAELREFLAGQLPAALVPTFFVFLDRLPLMPNGKVDRNALPAPPAAKPYVGPRTKLEHTLAGLWQQALRVERIGLEDDFFELGGNSLLLTQVHDKMRKLLNRDLPITSLFQYPTIRSLAGHLSGKTSVSNARQRAARQIAMKVERK
jgi:acyl-CoA synthetase (AMP-forming)/AMP-acid ligase II